jgi:hypothetical protein
MNLDEFQAMQQETERLTGVRGGGAENDAKPQSVNLYDILDVLEAIEELLIVQNKSEKRAAIFFGGICIIFIVFTVIGWSAR